MGLRRWANVIVFGAVVIIHHRVVQLRAVVEILNGAIIMSLKRMSVGSRVLMRVERCLKMASRTVLMHLLWHKIILHHVVVVVLQHYKQKQLISRTEKK